MTTSTLNNSDITGLSVPEIRDFIRELYNGGADTAARYYREIWTAANGDLTAHRS